MASTGAGAAVASAGTGTEAGSSGALDVRAVPSATLDVFKVSLMRGISGCREVKANTAVFFQFLDAGVPISCTITSRDQILKHEPCSGTLGLLWLHWTASLAGISTLT